MNINDVSEKISVPKGSQAIWKEIFDKQMELAVKYKDIEKMGDLLETTENNIHTAKGQKWLKDFAWRTTEELAEAFEAIELLEEAIVAQEDKNGVLSSEERNQYYEHFKEELIDALHFFVEFSIIAGYDHTFVPNLEGKQLVELDEHAWSVVYPLGLVANTFKNKPWKQTQMLTDKNQFEKHFKATWTALIKLLWYHLGSEEQMYIYYFKKNKVNAFRQRSNY